jgi:hypothetical protein
MKKLLGILAFCALLALGPSCPKAQVVGPNNNIQCSQYAQFTVAVAGTSSLVNGVAQKIIYICGWHVTSTGTSTFQLEYGTQGGPCTSPTTITPALNVNSTAPTADHIDYASLNIPAGAQLCLVAAGTTVQLAGVVYYGQY